ncbi:MAG: hypothetical protein ABIQ52_10680 [Vicinamibacterales bacterium]
MKRRDGSGPTRRQWIVLGALFLLSLPAVTTRIYSSDEIQYFAYLRSAWFDHDLSFENEYRYFYDRGIAKSAGFHETFLERSTDTGRRINFGTVGCAILWSPFYLLGDVTARASGATVDGFSRPYVVAVAYGSAVYGFLAVVLAVLGAARLGLNAFTAAVAVWLGTPLLFYMYVAPPFSHACSAFGVALFIYVWLRVRDDWSLRGAIALGAAAALMSMVREQDLFFIAGPALDWLLTGARFRRTSDWRGPVGAAAAFAAGFSPQLAAYAILNGHIGPHASVGHKMNWTAPHALQVLFSPEHGFFIWTPLALLALPGIAWLWRAAGPESGEAHVVLPGRRGTPSLADRQQIGACLVLMLALQVYVGGSVESWTVAGAYGQRRFIALTAIMVIGYAAVQAEVRVSSRQVRRLFALVSIVAVYWNLALIAEFSTGLMDRQRLEPRRNAFDAFVTLPRLAPSLAYRYLFDRASFYKHGS